MFWCFRCVRNLLGAILALAGLLALTEVGLRVQRITQPLPAPTADESRDWAVPSAVSGWELPPLRRQSVTVARGETVLWRTNSLGLRGEEVIVPKPAGAYRIIVLGDDAVLAPTVPDPSTLPQRLQQRLQSLSSTPVEVVNAALPHLVPETGGILYRQRLLGLQPDLVILPVRVGQVAEEHELRKWMIRDPQGQALACVHPTLGAAPKVLPVANLRREFALVDRLCTELGPKWSDLPEVSSQPPTVITPAQVEQLLAPIAPLAALCRATSATLVVSIVATSEAELATKLDGGQPFQQMVFESLARRRIPVVDGTTALQSRDDFETAFPGWSVQGHARQADFLATQIVQNLRGPWSAPSTPPTTLPANYSRPAQDPAGLPSRSLNPR